MMSVTLRATPLTIACAVSDQAVLIRVTQRIRQHGAQSKHLARAELLQATPDRAIAALVYDMEPGGAPAVDLIRAVRHARPEWPIWIYYAPRPLLMDAAALVASFRGIWATARVTHPAGEAEIDVHVRRLLTSAPRARLLRLLKSVLEPLPREVGAFLQTSLEGTSHIAPVRVKAANGTPHPRSRLRHLERLCDAADLPGPKRLLDHVWFVLLTYVSFAFDIPLRRVAAQEGLSRKGLERLRRRLLGGGAHVARLQPDVQFELALMSLTKVCGTPPQSADDIVQEVLGERQA